MRSLRSLLVGANEFLPRRSTAIGCMKRKRPLRLVAVFVLGEPGLNPQIGKVPWGELGVWAALASPLCGRALIIVLIPVRGPVVERLETAGRWSPENVLDTASKSLDHLRSSV